jgi:hypothetical protein
MRLADLRSPPWRRACDRRGAEGYVRALDVDSLVDRLGLDGQAARSNVRLRVVDDAVWPFSPDQRYAGRYARVAESAESAESAEAVDWLVAVVVENGCDLSRAFGVAVGSSCCRDYSGGVSGLNLWSVSRFLAVIRSRAVNSVA